jgi:hypothetical protein
MARVVELLEQDLRLRRVERERDALVEQLLAEAGDAADPDALDAARFDRRHTYSSSR